MWMGREGRSGWRGLRGGGEEERVERRRGRRDGGRREAGRTGAEDGVHMGWGGVEENGSGRGSHELLELPASPRRRWSTSRAAVQTSSYACLIEPTARSNALPALSASPISVLAFPCPPSSLRIRPRRPLPSPRRPFPRRRKFVSLSPPPAGGRDRTCAATGRFYAALGCRT